MYRWATSLVSASTMTAATLGGFSYAEPLILEGTPSLVDGQSQSAQILSQDWIAQAVEAQAYQAYLDEQEVELISILTLNSYLDREAYVEQQRRAANAAAVDYRIQELSQYVGKTPYILSGSSPDGWDCSGLTLWFYQGLGIELPHSANEQSKLGREVTEPRPGDLVFYGNNDVYHHVGVFVGNDVVLHSGYRKGYRTEYTSPDDPKALASQTKFVRFIETE